LYGGVEMLGATGFVKYRDLKRWRLGAPGRNRIPEIIHADGHNAVTRVLDEQSYQAALLEKLTEKDQEARHAPAGQPAAELAEGGHGSIRTRVRQFR
jgi:hypothetical protein